MEGQQVRGSTMRLFLIGLKSILSALIVVSVACCQAVSQDGVQAVDAPIDLPDDYIEREAALMKDDDRCGPEFLQTKLPKSFVKLVGPITDGPFRPVCKRHDACYRLKEHSQAWCDDRMRDEMIGICDTGKATPTYGVPVIGKPLCRFHAGLYYTAINSTLASPAYKGLPGGEIIDVRVRRINDWFSDDELEVCVDVINNTLVNQEYDVELHMMDGTLVDREPDTYEKNVRSDEVEEFCVGTNYTPWGINDLSDSVYVSIRADTPETFAITNDMVIVDTREITVPQD